MVDSSIVESCIPDEALRCIHIGLLCVQDNPNDRPLMSTVVFILENGRATLPVPNKPVYFANANNEVEVRGNNQNSNNSVTLSVLEGNSFFEGIVCVYMTGQSSGHRSLLNSKEILSCDCVSSVL